MNRQFRVVSVFLVSLVLTAGNFSFIPRTSADGPAAIPEVMNPNDPYRNAAIGEQYHEGEGLFIINQKENSGGGANFPDLEVLVVGTGVDSNHPDLAQSCLPSEFQDFTDQHTPLLDPDGHETQMAGAIAAVTDNGIGVSSINLQGHSRVKVISGKVFVPDPSQQSGFRANSSWVRAAYQYAINRRRAGYNLRIVNFSGYTADDRPDLTMALLSQMSELGIVLVVHAGNHNPGVNLDQTPGDQQPASYGSMNSFLVVTVAGLDESGLELHVASNWGPNTVSVAMPCVNIISTTLNGAYSSGSGTSLAAALFSKVLAAELLYGPETDSDRAVRQVLASCRDKGLSGKIKPDGGVPQMDVALGTSLVPPDPPAIEIASADWNGAKKLFLSGHGFTDNPQVFINGSDKSGGIKSASDKKIKIKTGLGLVPGNNVISVLSQKGSASFTLNVP